KRRGGKCVALKKFGGEGRSPPVRVPPRYFLGAGPPPPPLRLPPIHRLTLVSPLCALRSNCLPVLRTSRTWGTFRVWPKRHRRASGRRIGRFPVGSSRNHERMPSVRSRKAKQCKKAARSRLLKVSSSASNFSPGLEPLQISTSVHINPSTRGH